MAIVRARNIVGVPRFQYHELPDEGIERDRARHAVIDAEMRGFERDLASIKVRLKANIHSIVNKPGHISGLMHRKWIIRKMQTDRVWLERIIEGNLMHFLADGTYVTYM